MSTAANIKNQTQAVRYIKLGSGGNWEKECLDKGIIRIGFGSAKPERFDLCKSGRWDSVTKSFLAEGNNKGNATRFTNELRLFFEDDGSMLWITFMGERLCWGRMHSAKAHRHDDRKGWW